MRKKFSILTTLMLVLTLALTGCTSSTTDSEGIKVGFVTDVGGIDDGSFNQSTWEGIKRFIADNSTSESSFLQSTDESQYVPNLTALSDEDNDLIVAAGYAFDASLAEVAKSHTDQKFLVIDTVIDAPNVVSAVFAAEQGSFLVGVAAALKAQEMGATKVGFLGGVDMELIQAFEAGYVQGVKYVDPNMTVEVQYAGAFDKADVGKAIATKMYDEGITIIYHAAGGTGAGAIAEAKARATQGKEVYVIGVDRDQYADGYYDDAETKSVILTSMLKRVDNVAYDVAKSVLDGTFEGGKTLSYSLKDDGVGIPDENPNLSDEIVAKVNEAAAKIKSEEVVVSATPEA